MSWLARRAAARRRGVGKYDTAEARVYGETQGLGWLTADEEQAYLADLSRVVFVMTSSDHALALHVPDLSRMTESD